MNDLKLYRVRKEVEGKNKETGELEIKRYTNFYIQVVVNGNKINVPIRPVNFGNASNRTNYQLLYLASEEIKKEEKEVF